MRDDQGTFIVLEGSDGSGKTTQLQKLKSRLEAEGFDVVVYDFPRYSQPSSYFVRQYLSGAYGKANEIGPYTASLFYALDRFEIASKIRADLKAGKIVLADRYVGSNMAHQGTKFRNAEERRGFFIWLDNLEFQMLGIPRPTLSLVLRVPVDISNDILKKLSAKENSGKVLDIHEQEAEHLKRAVMVFDELCQLFPKDFVRIDCTRDDKLLDVETIQELVWQKIQPLLPEKPAKKKSSSPVSSENKSHAVIQNPYLKKNENGIIEITGEGKRFLEKAVTNANDNVYAFTSELPPAIIAATMALRAHRVDDLRLTILEEIAGKEDESDIFRKVLENYGAGKLKSLAGLHVVVEGASNLLTKNLEWSKSATHLELTSPFTFLDFRDSKGNYSYYVPKEFNDETTQQYRFYMDQIFDNYSVIIKNLIEYIEQNSVTDTNKRTAAWKMQVRIEACKAAAAVLPVATTTTVGLFASVQTIENLIVRLLSDDLPESQIVGKKILNEARKIMPVFQQSDEIKLVDSVIDYKYRTGMSFRKLSYDSLPPEHAYAPTGSDVSLVEASPRNELDLIPDMLYENSSLPIRELRSIVGSWQYDKKLEIYQAYFGNRDERSQVPGNALENALYSWDIVSDYETFRIFQSKYEVEEIEIQSLSPRYGFNTPNLIEEALLEETYEKCFEISLNLYSLLQKNGYSQQAQYASLLGHKLRYKIKYTAKEAFSIHENAMKSISIPYRNIVRQMHDKLLEVHPGIAEAMKFARF